MEITVPTMQYATKFTSPKTHRIELILKSSFPNATGNRTDACPIIIQHQYCNHFFNVPHNFTICLVSNKGIPCISSTRVTEFSPGHYTELSDRTDLENMFSQIGPPRSSKWWTWWRKISVAVNHCQTERKSTGKKTLFGN